MTTFIPGRLPNDPSKPRLRLADSLTKIAYPPTKDFLSKVSDWPMYLNDRYGDCTCAGAGHIIEQVTTYASGTTVKISDNDVVKAYSAVSGFDPLTGANDNGAVMQDVLNYWRKTGIGGHKILAFAEVNVKNLDELRAALDLFGTLYIGINFPGSAMDQFDAGKPWDVVPGATVEGGHAINTGYYDVASNTWKVVTWGRVQDMTQAFWDKYVEEAWVVVTNEWLKDNKNPDGVDMEALGQDFVQITGGANPFPVAPSPQPVPTPAPSPAPSPAPVDDFVAYAREWASHKHYFYKDFQDHLRSWLNKQA